MPAEFPPSAPWSVLGHLVSVYALVGLDDRMLLLNDQNTATYRLPSTLVHPGESVEEALRRAVLEQVGADVDNHDFYAAVELRDHTSVSELAAFELAMVFDVTPVAAASSDHARDELCWVDTSDMNEIDLRPGRIGEMLRSERLVLDRPWWPDQSS